MLNKNKISLALVVLLCGLGTIGALLLDSDPKAPKIDPRQSKALASEARASSVVIAADSLPSARVLEQGPTDGGIQTIPSEDSNSIRIRAIDNDAEPVAEVEVLQMRGESIHSLGVTDETGELVVGGLDLIDSRIQGVKAGHYCIPAYTNERTGGFVELKMLEEGQLRGRVLHVNGRPVGSDFRVVAWTSSHRSPPRNLVSRAIAEDPEAPSAITAADGSFVIKGLDQRLTYNLIAGGPGYLIRQAQVLCSPGPEEFELTVAPAYGLYVNVVGPGGSALDTGADLSRGFQIRVSQPRYDPGISVPPECALRLAGLLATEEEIPKYSFHYALTADDERAAIGPVEFDSTLPGYEHHRREFYVPRLNGPIRTEAIELQRDEGERGAFTVILSGSSLGDPWAENRSDKLSHLVLESEDGKRMYSIPAFADGEHTLTGIPLGDYHVTLFSAACETQVEAAPGREAMVSIKSEEGFSSVSIDLSALGAIELEVQSADGSPFRGPLVAVVGHGPADEFTSSPSWSWSEVDFDHAPYWISGLVEGEYRVGLRYPQASIVGPNVPIAVRANALSRASFELE